MAIYEGSMVDVLVAFSFASVLLWSLFSIFEFSWLALPPLGDFGDPGRKCELSSTFTLTEIKKIHKSVKNYVKNVLSMLDFQNAIFGDEFSSSFLSFRATFA